MAQTNTTFTSNPQLALSARQSPQAFGVVAVAAIPGFQSSGAALAISRIAVQLIILAGMWLGLSRTSLTASQRRSTWLAIGREGVYPCSP